MFGNWLSFNPTLPNRGHKNKPTQTILHFFKCKSANPPKNYREICINVDPPKMATSNWMVELTNPSYEKWVELTNPDQPYGAVQLPAFSPFPTLCILTWVDVEPSPTTIRSDDVRSLGGCLFGKVRVSFVWGMCLVDAFRGGLVDGWFKKKTHFGTVWHLQM